MPKDYITVALKRLVFDRAKGCCEYCRSQARFAIESLVIEHVIPVSRNGATIDANLALACQGCNNYNKMSDALVVALYNPRTMLWRDHFAWRRHYLDSWFNAYRSCDRKYLAAQPGESSTCGMCC